MAKYFLDKSIFLNHLKYFSTIVGIIAQFVDLLLIGAMTIFCQNILDELVLKIFNTIARFAH